MTEPVTLFPSEWEAAHPSGKKKKPAKKEKSTKPRREKKKPKKKKTNADKPRLV